MGQAARIRRQNAREAIAARQACARRFEVDGFSGDLRLPADLYWGQIAADLAGPSNAGGQAIDATVRTSTGVSTASGSI